MQLQAETPGQNAQEYLKKENFTPHSSLAGRTEPPDPAEQREVIAQGQETPQYQAAGMG